MITAIVMISADSSMIPEVAERVANIDGVSEVYSVTGDIDLIALVRVPEFDDLENVVSRDVNKVEGVVDTFTHLAFRAYSRTDLGAAFSLGDGN